MHDGDHLACGVGLADEDIVRAKLADLAQHLGPSCDVDDRNRWLALAHKLSKPDTVEPARHLDVGENEVKQLPVLGEGSCFIAASCLDDLVAMIGQFLNQDQPDQELVFGKKYAGHPSLTFNLSRRLPCHCRAPGPGTGLANRRACAKLPWLHRCDTTKHPCMCDRGNEMADTPKRKAAEASPFRRPQEDPSNGLPGESDRIQRDVFFTAMQTTRMAMVLSDPRQPDAPIVYCNPAFCEQTGYPEDEVIGRNCRFLQGPATDQATVKRIADALSARENVLEEIYNYRRDGRGFWNALHVSPIFDADGQLLYFFGSQADVTRRKEAALQQQERLDTVGTMASGVAHAFNNLMTIVVASIDQAATQASTDRQRTQLARADAAARSAGRLTQQMLSFSRRQFLEEQSVNLNAAIRNLDVLIDEMVEDAVSVEFDLAAEPVLALLDVGQLELAVIAVVRNAADAMPKGGHIIIATREYRSWDADEGQSGQSAVELSVADKGDGMLPEVAQRATEPFFTTKSNSPGLGLSMVKGFVEQSRGRMRIESRAGQGTTVHLIFPKHVDNSSPPGSSPS